MLEYKSVSFYVSIFSTILCFMDSTRFLMTPPNCFTVVMQTMPTKLEMMTYSMTPWPFWFLVSFANFFSLNIDPPLDIGADCMRDAGFLGAEAFESGKVVPGEWSLL